MVWTALCEHTHAYVQQLEQFFTLMDEGQVGCSPAFCRGSVWDLSLHIQWSHMFLLIEDQGGQGYELFFKTRELKKKWMEQFEMAMWVSFSCCFVRSPHHKISSNNELKTKHSKDKNEKPRIAAATNEKQKDKIKNQGLIVFSSAFSFILYSFFFRPRVLPPSTHSTPTFPSVSLFLSPSLPLPPPLPALHSIEVKAT